MKALNATLTTHSTPTERSAQEISTRIRNGMHVLQDAFFDLEQGKVRYDAIPGSQAYDTYQTLTQELQFFDPAQLQSQAERLSFWINLYNALMVDGLIACGIRETVKESPGFFSKVAYQVGSHLYSLDDIEHGILRQNQAKHWLLPKPFGKHDPRRAVMLREPEARIHFTLVCGASSCPPIGVYQADKIEAQLDLAAAAFINSEAVQLFPDRNQIYLSKIFQWYGRDFGSRLDLILFLAQHRRETVEKSWLQEHAAHLSLQFLPYDWRLNRA